MEISNENQILNEGIRAAIINDIEMSTDIKRIKEEHRKRHECFTGRTREWVLRDLEKEFSKATAREIEHRTLNLNIVKKIIDKKARVYKETPSRETKKKSDAKLLSEFVDAIGFNDFMKKVNRNVELHRDVFVKTIPVINREESTDARKVYDLALEIITPDNFSVIVDMENPREALAVVFSYYYADSDFSDDYRAADGFRDSVAGPRNDKGQNLDNDKRYVFWSKHYHFTTNRQGTIVKAPDGNINPFGAMPGAFVHADQGDNFWSEGGETLCDNTIVLHKLLADMNYTAKFQGFGMGWMRGKKDQIPTEQTIGPAKFIILNQNDPEDPVPEVGFASPNADLGAQMSIIEQELAFFLTTEDLDPGAIKGKLEGGGGVNSGIQAVLEQAEPIASVEDDQSVYYNAEPEIMKSAARVLRKLADSKQLSSSFVPFANLDQVADKYSLVFGQPAVMISEAERLDLIDKKKRSGFYTEMDLMRDLWPNLTDSDLAAKLEQIKLEKQANAAAFGIPAKNEDKDDAKEEEEKELEDAD